ncbi:MAG: hypothetical protein HY774_11490 [Acidobacteria bacterium]|nr:hypothetical protein [Acidobacteriota bacterium]
MNNTNSTRLKFDMSQEAVDQRLRDVSELFQLGMSLQKATYLGKAKDILRSKEDGAPDITSRQSEDNQMLR